MFHSKMLTFVAERYIFVRGRSSITYGTLSDFLTFSFTRSLEPSQLLSHPDDTIKKMKFIEESKPLFAKSDTPFLCYHMQMGV